MSDGSKRWGMWVGVVLAIIVLAVGFFFIGRATAPATRFAPPNLGQIVVVNEDANGTAVRVSPGWTLVLQLPGNPSTGYTWNITPPDPSIVEVGPGPIFTPASRGVGGPGTLTFTGMAVGVGTTVIDGRYVSPSGQEEKTFELTIEVQSAAPTTSTLPRSTTSPTRPPTTTSAAPTTTTTAATTTTTAAPTTTAPPTSTSGSTTSTSGSTTTTTALPTTTTTVAPTTTTTAPPTTTTTEPPTTTSSIPLPTTTTKPGILYIDWTKDGQVLIIPATVKTVVVTLAGNPSTGYNWKLARFNDKVLKLQADPPFIPIEGKTGPGTPGYLVWTFDVIGQGSSPIDIQLLDPSGKVVDDFFVGLATAAEPR